MMNLYQRNNGYGKRRLFLATACIVVVLLIDGISGGKIRAALQNTVALMFSTTARTFTALKYSGFFSTRAALAAQNQALESQVARYQEQAAGYQALQEENAQLAAMVHLAQNTPGQTAPVVSSFQSSPYGTFLIGAGDAEHIARNDIVLTSDGFVIGRVASVNTHAALVSELLGPGMTIDAIAAGTGVSFTGAGGGNAHAQIPRGVTISVGDVVTSSQHGGRPIGIIGNVQSDPASAYSTVYMRLPANISSLQFVYVLAAAQ